MKLLTKLRPNQLGGIKVDWVVLSAALVGLGAAVLASISTGIVSIENPTAASINTIEVTTKITTGDET